MDSSVKKTITKIQESQWMPLAREDGSVSNTEQVAQCWHTMDKTGKKIMLVVHRQLIDNAKSDDRQTTLLSHPWGAVNEQTITCGRYFYRAIATHHNADGLDE